MVPLISRPSHLLLARLDSVYQGFDTNVDIRVLDTNNGKACFGAGQTQLRLFPRLGKPLSVADLSSPLNWL